MNTFHIFNLIRGFLFLHTACVSQSRNLCSSLAPTFWGIQWRYACLKLGNIIPSRLTVKKPSIFHPTVVALGVNWNHVCIYAYVNVCMHANVCLWEKKSVGFFRSEDEIDTGDLNHGGLMIWDFVHKLPPTKVEGKQPPNSFTHKTSQRPTEYLQLIPETIIEGSPHNKKSPYERNYLARMSWKVSVGVVPSFLLVISYHIPCIPIA